MDYRKPARHLFDENYLTIAATDSLVGLNYRESMLDAYDRAAIAYRHNPCPETRDRRREIKEDINRVYAKLNKAINRRINADIGRSAEQREGPMNLVPHREYARNQIASAQRQLDDDMLPEQAIAALTDFIRLTLVDARICSGCDRDIDHKPILSGGYPYGVCCMGEDYT